jgi:PAS domain S-box-containing protein
MQDNKITLGGDEFCLWEVDGKVFRIGILGTGPGFRSIMDIIHNETYQEFLPPMRLEAVAEPGPSQARLEHVRRTGAPVYDTLEEMLAKHPHLDIMVELVGSRPQKDLKERLPDHISLVDHTASIFLCGLHDMAKVTAHCQVNLDRQRVLLEAIVDEINEDILVLTPDGRVADMNKNVAERAQASRTTLLGRRCWEVQSQPDGSRFCNGPDPTCPLQETLAKGKQAEAMVTRVDKEGRLRYFRIYSYPIRNPVGHLTHVMIIHRNITDRTRQERHRQQSDKLAAIGEMSTYLAHEIRNPLFAIAGFTNSLLKSLNLKEEELSKLHIIKEETSRLDRMLNCILDFARPSRGLEGKVDLTELAESTVELMSLGYSKQGYTFLLDCQPKLPMAQAEPEAAKQCLVNLLRNSMEAMENGGEIIIRTRLLGDTVQLLVSDSGRGMSEEELEQVCSPFFSTKEKGCGLGLAMIKKIMEDLGGSIDIASVEGKGATVTLQFPAVLAASEDTGRNPDGKESRVDSFNAP